MEQLLLDWEARHATSGEKLEKVNTDPCSYNLGDQESGELHRKRTGLATASRALKDEFYYHGQCSKDHYLEPPEGRTRTRRAEEWTPEFCYAIIESYLKEVDLEMTRQAFPAEAMAEGEDVDQDNVHTFSTTFDTIHDNQDVATGAPSGVQTDEQTIRENEDIHEPSENLEAAAMKTSRAEWRKLPEATRIAVRSLHTMTGHSSVLSMQRILRTSRS